MKFVSLKSRGGDYLVVVANVAWLRTYENNQTQVGIVGGQPLLVAGTIEETAALILAGKVRTAKAASAGAVPKLGRVVRHRIEFAGLAEMLDAVRLEARQPIGCFLSSGDGSWISVTSSMPSSSSRISCQSRRSSTTR